MNRPREILLFAGKPNASTIPMHTAARMTTRLTPEGTIMVNRKSTMMIPSRIRAYEIPITDITEYASRSARPVCVAIVPKMIAPNRNHDVSCENPLKAVSKFAAPVAQ